MWQTALAMSTGVIATGGVITAGTRDRGGSSRAYCISGHLGFWVIRFRAITCLLGSIEPHKHSGVTGEFPGGGVG